MAKLGSLADAPSRSSKDCLTTENFHYFFGAGAFRCLNLAAKEAGLPRWPRSDLDSLFRWIVRMPSVSQDHVQLMRAQSFYWLQL
jgi:hypothetical protein